MNTPEYEATIEFVIYDNEFLSPTKRFTPLRLDGHVEVSFVEFLNDEDNLSLILDEFYYGIDDPAKGVTCYQCRVTYSYDEGDDSVGLYPGWLFGFDLDTLKQTHPVEEQLYLSEPDYEFPQDSKDEGYVLRNPVCVTRDLRRSRNE